jgi:hypothetical protein
MDSADITVRMAQPRDAAFARAIATEMEQSALARGTGISQRSTSYLAAKIMQGNAVIAHSPRGEWAGFSYIEAWNNEQIVSNSGLIVAPAFRLSGIARAIKKKIFELSRMKYPNAKIFTITTGAAIMKLNHELGFRPVAFTEMQDEHFWDGCRSCVNCSILESKNRKLCLCTAMLYDPGEHHSCSDEGLVY